MTAACGSVAWQPNQVILDRAALDFERLDQAYFDETNGAGAAAADIAADPNAYWQAMQVLRDAGQRFVIGAQRIRFPQAAQGHATNLLNAASTLKQHAFVEAMAPGACDIPADIRARNLADRSLRADLRLDPHEVPD